jgi:hypothetical protein
MTIVTEGIKEHAPVVGSDGVHVGTVDRIVGDRIKLTKSDPSYGGVHHYIDLDLVGSANGEQVQLNCTADEARSKWTVDVA